MSFGCNSSELFMPAVFPLPSPSPTPKKGKSEERRMNQFPDTPVNCQICKSSPFLSRLSPALPAPRVAIAGHGAFL